MADKFDRPGRDTERHIIERNRAAPDGEEDRSPSLDDDLDRLFGSHRDAIHSLCLR